MPAYTKPSDETHKIQAESRLIYAIWSHPRAHAGQEAAVEVRTSFVGEGAKIRITCYTEKGKRLEKIEGVVLNNRFNGTIIIPDKVKPDDMIYFEAELPKHRLKGESNSIPVRPAIQVSKIQWDRREVKREDVVTMTCQFESGVMDDDEAIVVIYEHNPNSCDFKVVSIPTTVKNNKVEMQWGFEYQDATDQIPTDAQMQPFQKSYANPEFFFMVVVDGIRIGEKRESGLMKFVDELIFECVNDDLDIASYLSYTVYMADGKEKAGSFGGACTVILPEVCPGPLDITIHDSGIDTACEVERSSLCEAGEETGEDPDDLLEHYMRDNKDRE
jgi:hypothetical protein